MFRKIAVPAPLALVLAGTVAAQSGLSVEDARAIAKEAYIYGFPLVDSYRIQYSYFVDRTSPEFKAPWNEIRNAARVYTPEDTAVQTPNSDTPYSQAGLDLRAEPVVLTVPPVEKGRYFSVQLVDAYTHNFAYIGSRATGNDGGKFLVAGPDWKGTAPAGITQVIRSETTFVLAWYRTQLIDAKDIENVRRIQAGYKVQPLSAFTGTPAPHAPPIDFVKPLTAERQRTSLDFFRILNFALGACPPNPSEQATLARFARLGIGRGLTFDPAALTPELRAAVQDGMADAWKEFDAFRQAEIDTGKVRSGDLFGTREFLKNNYLYRMTAAVLGIYGNSMQEAMYPVYFVDAAGQPLDTSRNRYVLRFAPGQLPPVNAFWSLTLYKMPESLLYANALNRYLINSPMLPSLKRDPDGGLTLYVQHRSPGAGQETNWLPAPDGPVRLILRLYWPKPEALDGRWKQPPLQTVPMTPASAAQAR